MRVTKPVRLIHALAVPAMLACASLAAALGQVEGSALTRPEMEDFLLNAEVVSQSDLSVGITGSQRATLTDGKFTHDAHIQTIDETKLTFEGSRGVELNFRDSYKFNIAAYRLDRLLGLDMVPASVERRVNRKSAALTWWVDDVRMMDLDRHRNNVEIPAEKTRQWNDQMHQTWVFNELVYNTDANLGNLLITNDWKLWMIDFTRAFRTHQTLQVPEKLARIDRRLLNGLRSLNTDMLTAELGRYLTGTQIRAILARRDGIVQFFEQQISKEGEAAVVCDEPGH